MPEALIALGSNVGDRRAHLQRALDALREQVQVLAVSPLYETAPMYIEDQNRFLNAAVRIETDLGPCRLLRCLKAIEAETGRHPSERFGPREIDLDLIAYGRLQYRLTKDGKVILQVPHPRVPERRFVLQPLHDVLPDGHLPGQGAIADLLVATNHDAGNVQRIEDALL